MLGWNRAEAAAKAKIAEATIQRIRQGQPVTQSNLDRLVEAMQADGIKFLPNNGVRLEKPESPEDR